MIKNNKVIVGVAVMCFLLSMSLILAQNGNVCEGLDPEPCYYEPDCVVGFAGCIPKEGATCSDIIGEYYDKDFPQGFCDELDCDWQEEDERCVEKPKDYTKLGITIVALLVVAMFLYFVVWAIIIKTR